MIVLHKLLPQLMTPLMILVAFALAGLALRRRPLGVWALGLLWVLSLPLVADALWLQLEQKARRPLAVSAPKASAIVVLSGITRVVQGEQGVVTVWADGSDRFWAGIDLYRTGRAPRLIFTGGRAPWAAAEQSEGQWLREQALAFGVPEGDIVVTKEVTNTAEEAEAVAGLLPGASVLLVTSAFHSPRAEAIFKTAGLVVHPFPVDQRISQRDTTPMDFVPSAKALDRTTDALREYLGRGFYAIKHLTNS